MNSIDQKTPWIIAAVLAVVLIANQPDKPKPPGPSPNISAQATASVKAYAAMLSANTQEASEKIRDGEFKGPEEAHDWLLKQNDGRRKEAFKRFNEMLDEAGESGLERALREASGGFMRAAK